MALQGTAARAAGGRVLAARPPPPSEVNAGSPKPAPPNPRALGPAELTAGRAGEAPRLRPGKDGGGAGRDRAEAGHAACAAALGGICEVKSSRWDPSAGAQDPQGLGDPHAGIGLRPGVEDPAQTHRGSRPTPSPWLRTDSARLFSFSFFLP